ncbi:hypothetical protein [Blastopirellula marina]|uniref:Uncharacterized protein n=1 Tax=Blastopirellula marina DSM 3645 TaxID=314230 RepID=A4A0B6_9BACT|nr:hypothetical protein [Blastopirellula marina]EAQ77736.1 hypothetical protein DSM3645_25242 [Blastopirellula marina DSM 3645]
MSWTLEIRVFARIHHKTLIESDDVPHDFFKFPFASENLFTSKLNNICHEADCIFDDATTLKANHFAATSRLGMLFCLDPERLIVDDLPPNCDADIFLSVSLSGVSEHLEFKARVFQEIIRGNSDDASFHDSVRVLAGLSPWKDLVVTLSQARTWDTVERLAFELLSPFIGVNYFFYSGQEPILGIFKVNRPWFGR